MEGWALVAALAFAAGLCVALGLSVWRARANGQLSGRAAALAIGSLLLLVPGLPVLIVVTRDGGVFLLATMAVTLLVAGVFSTPLSNARTRDPGRARGER